MCHLVWRPLSPGWSSVYCPQTNHVMNAQFMNHVENRASLSWYRSHFSWLFDFFCGFFCETARNAQVGRAVSRGHGEVGDTGPSSAELAGHCTGWDWLAPQRSNGRNLVENFRYFSASIWIYESRRSILASQSVNSDPSLDDNLSLGVRIDTGFWQLDNTRKTCRKQLDTG